MFSLGPEDIKHDQVEVSKVVIQDDGKLKTSAQLLDTPFHEHFCIMASAKPCLA